MVWSGAECPRGSMPEEREQQQGQRQAGHHKRKYPRIELSRGMLVAWQAGGCRQVARVATLSVGGIFVTTPNPPTAGTILQLVFEVPDGDVRVRGGVVYVQPGKGMGIHFRGMAANERARFAHLLKRLLQ